MMQRTCFYILFSLSLCSCIIAQDRAPHGLAYQNPAAFSPTAYDFFHSNAGQDPCLSSHCSPFPLAAHVQETGATATPIAGTTSFGAGAVAGPAFAAIVILCMVMGIYYVAKTRQANVNRTKAGQPDV